MGFVLEQAPGGVPPVQGTEMEATMAAKLTKAQWEARRKQVRAEELPDFATVTVDVAGAVAKMSAALRDFSTGSRGYHTAERVTTEHGAFQVNVTVTQVGSGPYRES